ncbi:MAG TPA: DUF2238 domain-containing protein [Allosphingosinicella sp.]|nr:DUF2238 domain-containing protein [Allosphingosinicella sp.]
MRKALERWRALPAAQRAMLAALAALVVLVQIRQPYPEIAWLQHVPTVALLLSAPFLLSRWPMSNAAVGCVLLFFALHTVGGRWTYSNVPYDQWAQALTGHPLSDLLGTDRNHYDRLVHFSYGALAILPVREALSRHLGVTPRIALYIAIESVLAVSALYEMFEWLLTLALAGPLAAEYNGQQGDMWDAQKDMALAALGAALSTAWQWRRRDGG